MFPVRYAEGKRGQALIRMTREWSEANQNEAEPREDASSIYTEPKGQGQRNMI
jgi:hypothetical protein